MIKDEKRITAVITGNKCKILYQRFGRMFCWRDEESVIHTMNDLEKKKVICGYHTIINWEKTNKDKVMALIEVDVTPERDFGYDRVAKNIYRYPEVDTMYLMSGKERVYRHHLWKNHAGDIQFRRCKAGYNRKCRFNIYLFRAEGV